MNSTLLVRGIVIATSLCICLYFYRTQDKKYNNNLLRTECKNMSKMLQFFQKERRYCVYIPRNKLCEEMQIYKIEPKKLSNILWSLNLIKISNIFNTLKLQKNNDTWYFIIRDNLIYDILSFLEKVSEYNSFVEDITDNNPLTVINKIHFCVIDTLCKNIEYVDLIKDICEKYFGYEIKIITEILITHVHQDTLKIIIDYMSIIPKVHLLNFDHIINNHRKSYYCLIVP